jgi:hypothetical protein
VAYKVWRARGLSIGLTDARRRQIKLSGEVLDELTAGAKVAITDRQDGRLTFTAPQPLIFGLTLRELDFTDGGVTDLDVKDHMRLRATGPEPETFDFASDDDLFVELTEPLA